MWPTSWRPKPPEPGLPVKQLLRTPVVAWRLLRVLLHILRGVLTVALVLPWLGPAARHRQVQAWAQAALRALGMRLVVEGQPRPGATLLVANHVSWLDITAIHAVCPQARFVSKAEVRRWPLLRHLSDAAGTLYLSRESRRDALRVVHQVSEALQAGDVVAVFPEGTTSDGRSLLPFHGNMLQAAIAVEVPVQPLALRYSDAESAISRAAPYIDQISLVASVLAVVRARGLTLRVQWLPARGSRHADRRALAHSLRADIAEALGLPAEAAAGH